jgi:hypothetical protein
MVTPDLSRTSAPACGYATSVILPAGQQANDEGQGARRSRPDQAAAARALMVLAAEYWGARASLAVSSLFPKREVDRPNGPYPPRLSSEAAYVSLSPSFG